MWNFFELFLPQNTSTPWRIYLDDGLLVNKNNGYAYHKPNISKDLLVKYSFGEYHNRTYGLEKQRKKYWFWRFYTFGWLIHDKDTFIYKIANKFQNYEFINSAAGGHGTSDRYDIMKSFVKK